MTAEYDNLLALVQKRRSTRKFQSDPIPNGSIEKIIDVGRYAPSGFHTQPWEFVAITEKDVRERIIAVLDEKSPPITNPDPTKDSSNASFRDAPVFIIALCDRRAYVGLPGNLEKEDPKVDSIFHSSMASAFVYMHLAAAALGLASQWYTATGRAATEQAIRAIIGIPESLKIYDMMILGYPAASPVPKTVRSLKHMVHYNNCGMKDFRTDDQVAAEAAATKAWCLSAH